MVASFPYISSGSSTTDTVTNNDDIHFLLDLEQFTKRTLRVLQLL